MKYPNRPEWTEVFDLAADPYEIKNLAADAALTAKLEAELDSADESGELHRAAERQQTPPAAKVDE